MVGGDDVIAPLSHEEMTDDKLHLNGKVISPSTHWAYFEWMMRSENTLNGISFNILG